MTEKLYYNDPRMESFQARLVHHEQEGDHWIVVLDRTAFYPEGGGQPADKGRLNGIPVIDVREREGEIYHVLPEALKQGVPVQGMIDFPTRFDFMQQHTGQHIISASLIEAAGYPTVSAYLGDSYTAVEIDTDSIQDAQIEAAEVLANRTVTRNLPVHIHWIQPEEAERYHLRKPPPDVRRLRIVEIEGVDAAACAGIHVEKTGEVGLIKFDGLEKIRGRLRLHWLIGDRAFRDVRAKDHLTAALNRELTCGTADILASVRELKNKLREREQRISQLEKRYSDQKFQELLASAERKEGILLRPEVPGTSGFGGEKRGNPAGSRNFYRRGALLSAGGLSESPGRLKDGGLPDQPQEERYPVVDRLQRGSRCSLEADRSQPFSLDRGKGGRERQKLAGNREQDGRGVELPRFCGCGDLETGTRNRRCLIATGDV
jgi:alanyl-tRNA synthetase